MTFNPNVTMTSNLNISGNSTFLGSVTAVSTLNVSGNTILQGPTTTSSTLNIVNNAIVNGNLIISGNSRLNGPITAISTLNVSGNTLLQGPTTAISNLNISGNTIIENALTSMSTVNIKGNITATSNLNISGTSTLNNTTINETLQINKITLKPANSFNLVSNGLINLTNGLAFLNPSSDVTGIKLSSSTVTGATSIIVNKSEFTIEFSETESYMISPTSTFIYPHTTILIVWDGSNWIPTRDA